MPKDAHTAMDFVLSNQFLLWLKDAPAFHAYNNSTMWFNDDPEVATAVDQLKKIVLNTTDTPEEDGYLHQKQTEIWSKLQHNLSL